MEYFTSIFVLNWKVALTAPIIVFSAKVPRSFSIFISCGSNNDFYLKPLSRNIREGKEGSKQSAV